MGACGCVCVCVCERLRGTLVGVKTLDGVDGSAKRG